MPNDSLLIFARFDAQDQKLEGIDCRFDVVDQKLEAIDHTFELVDQRFDHLELKLTGLDTVVSHLVDEVGGIKNRLVVVEEELVIVGQRLVVLENKFDQFSTYVVTQFEALTGILERISQELTLNREWQHQADQRIVRIERKLGLT